MRDHEAPKKHAVFPASADVEAHVREVAKRRANVVKVRTVMKSVEGRPILAATVTDPNVPDRDKQVVLVAGGQHGNEESGRAVALGLLDWLTTREAARTRRTQKVVIMPNVSPDACERDQYVNVEGVNPNRDHALSGPTSPEGEALEKMGYALQPEVFVDLHACGGTGCGVDLTLFPPPRKWTEDGRVLHLMAEDMVDAGGRAGIPQSTFPIAWWGLESLDAPSSTVFFYRNFKTLQMLTENTESNRYAYPLADRVRAGVAKLKALLAWGSRRHPDLPAAGYPNMLVGGTFDRGIVAVGKDAAARRRSRVGIWRNIDAFAKFTYDIPQEPKLKRVLLEYQGETLKSGAGIQTCARGKLKVDRVVLEGRRLRQSPIRGWTSWATGCATYTVIAMGALEAGEYVAEIQYR